MALTGHEKHHLGRCENLRSLASSKRPHRSFVFHQVLKEQTFGNGYQQRLCCLKILSVIYKTVNMKFQEAQWILSSCELRQQQKPHCEGFFHPQHRGCGEHPRLCLFSVLCFATYCWETEQFQGKDNLRPSLSGSGLCASPSPQFSGVHRPKTQARMFSALLLSIKVEGCHYRCAVCAASAKRKLLLHSSVNFLNSLCVYVHVCTHAHIHISSGIWMCLCMYTMCGFSAIQKAPDECSEISIFP